METEIARRRTILYFGNDWYAENRTSSHHIASCLAAEHDVYYLECPGLRAPQTSGRDVRKLISKVLRFLRGTRRVTVPGRTPNEVDVTLHVRTLFQIPLHRYWIVRLINQWLLLLTIRTMMIWRGIRRPIAWHMVPHLSNTVGQLGEDLIVYYCIDDYASLPGVGSESVRQMDERLTKAANAVFVASDTLYDKKHSQNPHTYLSPHGVDLEHFGQVATKSVAIPQDVSDLRYPVIGFFGLVEQWIDLDLVAELASRRPEWSFLLIGRVAVSDAPRAANIHYLGHRPYDQLPAYASVFDVAIIPYRATTQVYHANPIKLREYLATGKPVVSVRTPQIDQFSDVVAIADSFTEFERHIENALSERSRSLFETNRRRQRVSDMSWQAVVHRAWSKVLQLSLAGNSGAKQPALLESSA